ncbi:MAG: radical SAM protein [Vulcanimicrobiaceae bacterium]
MKPERILAAHKPSRFNAMRSVEQTLVLGNSFTGAVVAFDSDEVSLVKPLLRGIAGGDAAPPLALDLIELGFLVPAGRDELAAVEALRVALNDPCTLDLIVMPTEDCNFRCVYCYETFAKKAMQPETRERLKAFLRKTIPNLNSLRLAWFGGEPLLAFPVMVEIAEYARSLCDAYGVHFESSITTNAYLLDDRKIDFLQATQCRNYQITLDGTQETHDRTRPLREGGKTFEVIWSNLLRLQAAEYAHNVLVRVNVHQDNYDAARELVALFTEAFGRDQRFTIDFHTLWDGGSAWGNLRQLADREPALHALCTTALGANTRDCIGFNAFGPGTRYCYSGRANSLVVGSDAALYKCTLAFEDARNQIGKLTDSGEALVDDEKLARWTSGSDYRSDAACRDCFYVPSCMGAFCPFTRIVEGRRPCPPEKVNPAATLDTAYAVRSAVLRAMKAERDEGR